MGQLKVRFTIQDQGTSHSFTTMSELEQLSMADSIMNRLIELESRIKLIAANHWLTNRIGQDKVNTLQIRIERESESL